MSTVHFWKKKSHTRKTWAELRHWNFKVCNAAPSPNSGSRFNFPGIDPLLGVWAGRPFPIWPLLPASTHLRYLVSPVFYLLLWRAYFSQAFLTTNRNAGPRKRLIRIRYFCEDFAAGQHWWQPQGMGSLPHNKPEGSGDTLLQGLFVSSSFTGAHMSLQLFLFCLKRAQEWEQWQGRDRSSLEEKGNLCPGRQQFRSSPLPRLQGNTSLEILIKEASGCPVLLPFPTS